MTIKRLHFDKEYSTTFLKEVDYLKDNGVYPCYVKKIDDTIIYKYTKEKVLFKCLCIFYTN